jgi:hypothetical protein
MMTRIFSLAGLILLVLLAVLALPNWIRMLSSTEFSLPSVLMSGLVIIVFLAGAIMLFLFGVIGRKEPQI